MNAHHLDVTLGTPFHIECAVLPGVHRRRRGVVVNVSSVHRVAADEAALLRRPYGSFTSASPTVTGAARMAR
jgi:hypothetical protein